MYKKNIPGSILKIQDSYFTYKPYFVRRKNYILEARLNSHFLNSLLFKEAKEEGVRRRGGSRKYG